MKLVNTMRESAFLRHNAIFFVGSIVVGGLNYAYYPILGRLLSPIAFGELQVIVTLFLQFTIFLNVLSMVTVNIVVNHTNKTQAHRIIFEIEKVAAYVTAAVLLVTVVAGEWLRQALHFASPLPFIMLGLAMLVSIPLTFRSAYARGQKRFAIASVSQFLGAMGKIIASSILVLIGFGVVGAIFGIVVAQLIAFLYAARWAARIGFRRPSDTHYGTLPDLKVIRPELPYAGAVFSGLLAVTMLMSVDIIVVKYFFDAHTAGLYAGIATVARIVFFLAAPIAQVLMSSVKIGHTARQNSQLLLRSLLLTLLACSPVVVACCLAPAYVVRGLMGVEYITFAPLLPLLTIAIFVLSVVNLVFMYFLALRKKMVTLVGIIGLAVSLSFILAEHYSVQAVVNSLLLGSIFTLFATGIYVLVSLKRGVRHAEQNNFNRYTNL